MSGSSSRTMNSSDHGTISFEKAGSVEMERMLADDSAIIKNAGFLPLSESSSRKRKFARPDCSSVRKRQCVQQIRQTSPNFLEMGQAIFPQSADENFPMQFEYTEEPAPMTDEGDGMHLMTIDDEDLFIDQQEQLRLTEGPSKDLQHGIEQTQIAYQKGLCNWLNKMRKSKIGTDMRFLTSGDKLLNAHRFIVRSLPFFDDILRKNGEIESNLRTLISVEADADTMKNILDFLYTGTCNITKGNAFTILEHAARIDFVQLVEACTDLVKKWGLITPTNCISIVKLLEQHPDCEPCQALREYALGTLCDQKFLECILESESQVQCINDLSEDALETLLFKSVHSIDSPNDGSRLDGLWKVVKKWIGDYEEKVLKTRENSLQMLNMISHRKGNFESSGHTFDIVVAKDKLHGYSCKLESMGVTFELKLSVGEDADGVNWLGLRLDMAEDDLKPTWYRSCGFKYEVISEDNVFARCKRSSVHFEKDFRKAVAGARRMETMEELTSSYINRNGDIHIQVRVEPDHITGFSMHYIINNFQEIWEEHRDVILSFGVELLSFILKQDALNVKEEGLVLKIICLWLTDENLDVDLFDEQDIIDLLSCVRWNFTNSVDMDKAFDIMHRPKNANTKNFFSQCAKKLPLPNDNPRDSYKDRSPTFQAWQSIFRNDWIVSSQVQRMLNCMSNIYGNISPENVNISKSQLEAQISQEVGAHCASHCATFLHNVLHKHEVKCS